MPVKAERIVVDRRALLGAVGALAAKPAWALDALARSAELVTDLGVIRLQLSARAPLTTANFLRYLDSGRLSGATFYRAARAKGVSDVGLIEGGLQNDPAKLFPPVAHESTADTGLAHLDGTISMARDAPGSATADFFICSGAAPYLDTHPGAPGDNAGYAAFGQVSDGMDVVHAILRASTDGPARNPVMQGQMLDAPVRITRAARARVA